MGRIASKVSMAKIIWQNTAKQQLIENITCALIEFGETTANRWETDVHAVESRLERYPTSYPPEPLLSSSKRESVDKITLKSAKIAQMKVG